MGDHTTNTHYFSPQHTILTSTSLASFTGTYQFQNEHTIIHHRLPISNTHVQTLYFLTCQLKLPSHAMPATFQARDKAGRTDMNMIRLHRIRIHKRNTGTPLHDGRHKKTNKCLHRQVKHNRPERATCFQQCVSTEQGDTYCAILNHNKRKTGTELEHDITLSTRVRQELRPICSGCYRSSSSG